MPPVDASEDPTKKDPAEVTPEVEEDAPPEDDPTETLTADSSTSDPENQDDYFAAEQANLAGATAFVQPGMEITNLDADDTITPLAAIETTTALPTTKAPTFEEIEARRKLGDYSDLDKAFDGNPEVAQAYRSHPEYAELMKQYSLYEQRKMAGDFSFVDKLNDQQFDQWLATAKPEDLANYGKYASAVANGDYSYVDRLSETNRAEWMKNTDQQSYNNYWNFRERKDAGDYSYVDKMNDEQFLDFMGNATDSEWKAYNNYRNNVDSGNFGYVDKMSPEAQADWLLNSSDAQYKGYLNYKDQIKAGDYSFVDKLNPENKTDWIINSTDADFNGYMNYNDRIKAGDWSHVDKLNTDNLNEFISTASEVEWNSYLNYKDKIAAGDYSFTEKLNDANYTDFIKNSSDEQFNAYLNFTERKAAGDYSFVDRLNEANRSDFILNSSTEDFTKYLDHKNRVAAGDYSNIDRLSNEAYSDWFATAKPEDINGYFAYQDKVSAGDYSFLNGLNERNLADWQKNATGDQLQAAIDYAQAQNAPQVPEVAPEVVPVLSPDGTVVAPVDGAVVTPALSSDGTVVAPVLSPDGTVVAPVLSPDGTVNAPADGGTNIIYTDAAGNPLPVTDQVLPNVSGDGAPTIPPVNSDSTSRAPKVVMGPDGKPMLVPFGAPGVPLPESATKNVFSSTAGSEMRVSNPPVIDREALEAKRLQGTTTSTGTEIVTLPTDNQVPLPIGADGKPLTPDQQKAQIDQNLANLTTPEAKAQYLAGLSSQPEWQAATSTYVKALDPAGQKAFAEAQKTTIDQNLAKLETPEQKAQYLATLSTSPEWRTAASAAVKTLDAPVQQAFAAAQKATIEQNLSKLESPADKAKYLAGLSTSPEWRNAASAAVTTLDASGKKAYGEAVAEIVRKGNVTVQAGGTEVVSGNPDPSNRGRTLPERAENQATIDANAKRAEIEAARAALKAPPVAQDGTIPGSGTAPVTVDQLQKKLTAAYGEGVRDVVPTPVVQVDPTKPTKPDAGAVTTQQRLEAAGTVTSVPVVANPADGTTGPQTREQIAKLQGEERLKALSGLTNDQLAAIGMTRADVDRAKEYQRQLTTQTQTNPVEAAPATDKRVKPPEPGAGDPAGGTDTGHTVGEPRLTAEQLKARTTAYESATRTAAAATGEAVPVKLPTAGASTTLPKEGTTGQPVPEQPLVRRTQEELVRDGVIVKSPAGSTTEPGSGDQPPLTAEQLKNRTATRAEALVSAGELTSTNAVKVVEQAAAPAARVTTRIAGENIEVPAGGPAAGKPADAKPAADSSNNNNNNANANATTGVKETTYADTRAGTTQQRVEVGTNAPLPREKGPEVVKGPAGTDTAVVVKPAVEGQVQGQPQGEGTRQERVEAALKAAPEAAAAQRVVLQEQQQRLEQVRAQLQQREQQLALENGSAADKARVAAALHEVKVAQQAVDARLNPDKPAEGGKPAGRLGEGGDAGHGRPITVEQMRAEIDRRIQTASSPQEAQNWEQARRRLDAMERTSQVITDSAGNRVFNHQAFTGTGAVIDQRAAAAQAVGNLLAGRPAGTLGRDGIVDQLGTVFTRAGGTGLPMPPGSGPKEVGVVVTGGRDGQIVVGKDGQPIVFGRDGQIVSGRDGTVRIDPVTGRVMLDPVTGKPIIDGPGGARDTGAVIARDGSLLTGPLPAGARVEMGGRGEHLRIDPVTGKVIEGQMRIDPITGKIIEGTLPIGRGELGSVGRQAVDPTGGMRGVGALDGIPIGKLDAKGMPIIDAATGKPGIPGQVGMVLGPSGIFVPGSTKGQIAADGTAVVAKDGTTSTTATGATALINIPGFGQQPTGTTLPGAAGAKDPGAAAGLPGTGAPGVQLQAIQLPGVQITGAGGAAVAAQNVGGQPGAQPGQQGQNQQGTAQVPGTNGVSVTAQTGGVSTGAGVVASAASVATTGTVVVGMSVAHGTGSINSGGGVAVSGVGLNAAGAISITGGANMTGGVNVTGASGLVGLSGTGLPGTGLPGTGLPGTGIVGLPGTGLPGAGVAGLPGTGLPGAGVAGLPGTGLPGTGLPGTGLPGAGLPGTGVPGSATTAAGTVTIDPVTGQQVQTNFEPPTDSTAQNRGHEPRTIEVDAQGTRATTSDGIIISVDSNRNITSTDPSVYIDNAHGFAITDGGAVLWVDKQGQLQVLLDELPPAEPAPTRGDSIAWQDSTGQQYYTGESKVVSINEDQVETWHENPQVIVLSPDGSPVRSGDNATLVLDGDRPAGSGDNIIVVVDKDPTDPTDDVIYVNRDGKPLESSAGTIVWVDADGQTTRATVRVFYTDGNGVPIAVSDTATVDQDTVVLDGQLVVRHAPPSADQLPDDVMSDILDSIGLTPTTGPLPIPGTAIPSDTTDTSKGSSTGTDTDGQKDPVPTDTAPTTVPTTGTTTTTTTPANTPATDGTTTTTTTPANTPATDGTTTPATTPDGTTPPVDGTKVTNETDSSTTTPLPPATLPTGTLTPPVVSTEPTAPATPATPTAPVAPATPTAPVALATPTDSAAPATPASPVVEPIPVVNETPAAPKPETPAAKPDVPTSTKPEVVVVVQIPSSGDTPAAPRPVTQPPGEVATPTHGSTAPPPPPEPAHSHGGTYYEPTSHPVSQSSGSYSPPPAPSIEIAIGQTRYEPAPTSTTPAGPPIDFVPATQEQPVGPAAPVAVHSPTETKVPSEANYAGFDSPVISASIPEPVQHVGSLTPDTVSSDASIGPRSEPVEHEMIEAPTPRPIENFDVSRPTEPMPSPVARDEVAHRSDDTSTDPIASTFGQPVTPTVVTPPQAEQAGFEAVNQLVVNTNPGASQQAPPAPPVQEHHPTNPVQSIIETVQQNVMPAAQADPMSLLAGDKPDDAMTPKLDIAAISNNHEPIHPPFAPHPIPIDVASIGSAPMVPLSNPNEPGGLNTEAIIADLEDRTEIGRMMNSNQYDWKVEELNKYDQADRERRERYELELAENRRRDDEMREDKEQRELEERAKRFSDAMLAAMATKKTKMPLDAMEQALIPEVRQKYVVLQGDTLESIAVKKLRDKRLAPLLYEINKHLIPARIEGDTRYLQLAPRSVIQLPTQAEVRRFHSRLFGRQSIKFQYEAPTEQPANPRATNPGLIRLGLMSADTASRKDEDPVKAGKRRENVESLLGSVSKTATPPSDGRIRYICRLGDTLRSVAMRHPALKDVTLWKLLAEVNGLSTDIDSKGTPVAQFKRGTTVSLPTIEEIEAFKAKVKPKSARVDKITAPQAPYSVPATGDPSQATTIQDVIVPVAVDPSQAVTQDPVLASGTIVMTDDSVRGNVLPFVRPGEIIRYSPPGIALRDPEDATNSLLQAAGMTPRDAGDDRGVRNVIHHLNETCRIVNYGNTSGEGTGFRTRLEVRQEDFWRPVVQYEVNADVTLRHEFSVSGKRSTTRIDLPPHAAKELAENDISAHWEKYSCNFQLGRKIAD